MVHVGMINGSSSMVYVNVVQVSVVYVNLHHRIYHISVEEPYFLIKITFSFFFLFDQIE